MNPKLRTVLDQIDDVLVGEDTEVAGQLWDVLSGLRGPDVFQAHKVKYATTRVLRHRAFPKAFDQKRGTTINRDKAVGNSDDPNLVRMRQAFIGVAGDHFMKHYTWAFAALGLQIKELNS